jgi:hypothetical protein
METKKQPRQHRYALTMGEQAEIHVGGTSIGHGLAPNGYKVAELKGIADRFPSAAHLTILSDRLDEKDRDENQAAVLLIKKGINLIMRDPKYDDQMLVEQDSIQYDTQYFDRRRKTTLHKRARHNTVFHNQGNVHSSDYRQSTVIAYSQVPLLSKLRARLPLVLGEKALELNTEGNFYFETNSGIGFHGDGERKIVICSSLGTSTTLRFVWRAPKSSIAYRESFDLNIEHGDIYIMSEKATGFDWRCTSKFRLVHAAGSNKYLDPKAKAISKKSKF